MTARRGPDVESEVPLEARAGELPVRGRADRYQPRHRWLEEVKAIRGRPEDVPDNRRHPHWAQLQTCGAQLCRSRGLSQATPARVYFDVASQTETELRRRCSAAELEAAFEARCADFARWRGRPAGSAGRSAPCNRRCAR